MTARASSPRANAEQNRELLRLAAIDVGTNSIHMIVAQIDSDGAVTTLWRMKEPVGLGRLSFPNKTLTDAAMQPATAALSRFQQAAVQRGAEKIIAVATSAGRADSRVAAAGPSTGTSRTSQAFAVSWMASAGWPTA